MPAKAPLLSPDRTVAGISVALFLAVLVVFGRSFWFDFVDFDDAGNVSENPFVNRGLTFEGLRWAFSHTQVSNWIPLTTLSHMLDCQMFGLWPGGHHLSSVVLHGATSVLLFLVLRSMTKSLWCSAFVAAVFAVHPLRVESVAWVSERKDVLCALFFMLTLGAYVRWTRGNGRWIWVVVLFALGLLCKSMLVTLPLVLLVLDHWPLNRNRHIPFLGLVKEKIPLFALSAAAAIVQVLASRDTMSTMDSFPISARVANALVSCAAYVLQMIWPANLAGFYPFPKNGIDPAPLIAAVVLLAALSLIAFRWRHRAPWLAAGWLWYVIMLAPVLGLVQAGEVSRADRYTYLPQIGLYLMVAWTVGSWASVSQTRRIQVGIVSGVALVAAAVAAVRQTGFWKDSETLWQRALACTENNDTANYNLGTNRLQKGELDEAIYYFQKTLEANPRYTDAHINLGRAVLAKGRPDEALAHYERALAIKPKLAEAHYNLGIVLVQQRNLEGAINHYQQALAINPRYFDAQNNLGSTLLQAGRIDDAITRYESALQINPRSVRAHNNLAAALALKSRHAEAINHLESALEIEPTHLKALGSLAWLRATCADDSLRDGTRAVALAEKAHQLTGVNNAQVLRTLAAAYAEAGHFQSALQSAQRALTLSEDQGNDAFVRVLKDDIEHYRHDKPL